MSRYHQGSLSRLADANPVIPDDESGRSAPARALLTTILADEEAMTSARFGRTSTRRRVQVRTLTGGLAAAVAIVALLAVLPSTRGPSLVSRAYAATDTAGVIVHYKAVMHRFLRVGGWHTEWDMAVDAYVSGARSHIVLTGKGTGGGQQILTVGDRRVAYFASTHRLTHSTTQSNCPALVGLVRCALIRDPLTVIRELYHSGKIHAEGQTTLGGRRVDVLAGRSLFNGEAVSDRVLVDPHTLIPLEVQQTLTNASSGPRWVNSSTTTFASYQRLPVTRSADRLFAIRSIGCLNAGCPPHASSTR
jgi:hypothetical protein